MNKISIISTNGEIRIEADITNEVLNLPMFEVETPDYLIQVTQTADSMHVSNAINGYGQNVRDDFKDALIEVFV